MRGATGELAALRDQDYISIHAPLAGSDGKGEGCQQYYQDFNPRSPCGERPFQNGTGVFRVLFQSTLPLRGATGSHNSLHSVSYISIHAPLAGSDDPHGDSLSGVQDFNPRSPCGERQSSSLSFSNLANFNPRSPCGERLLTSLSPNSRSGFQSTLPLRGATRKVIYFSYLQSISIHAPLAGSDVSP